ncbi:MAG: hypothetical protein JWM93_2507, partial [Frankiales bacterium]|nr:hypothetical protein [Frankiales bacterium]
MASELTLSAVPFGLQWTVEPVDASTDGHSTLRATAGRQSDLFTHPSGEAVYTNAARAH